MSPETITINNEEYEIIPFGEVMQGWFNGFAVTVQIAKLEKITPPAPPAETNPDVAV